MSEKVLKFAGQRRTWLALIVATVTLGLLFAGWLTPTRSKADNGGSNPAPTVENISTNCTDGSVSLDNSTNTPLGCIGSPISVSVGGVDVTPAFITTTTKWSDGSTTITTNTPSPDYVVTWTAGVGSYSTNGTGSTATFTPTNSGSGTVSFTCNYTNETPCSGTGTSTASGGFSVDAVTSLTPSAGEPVDDGDDDPNTATYLVQCGCNATITVTAADCLGLDASALPSCWTVGPDTITKIDNKTYSVDGNTPAKTEIDVSCGSSYKKITIIVYKAKITIYADKGSGLGTLVGHYGHAWWNLSILPSEAEAFIPANLRPDEGEAGYWPKGWSLPIKQGEVRFGLAGQGKHTATSSYWWCLSFNEYIAGLTYVNNLAANPGEYVVLTCNCTTEAVATCNATGGTTIGSYNTNFSPAVLDTILSLVIINPPTCSCSQ